MWNCRRLLARGARFRDVARTCDAHAASPRPRRPAPLDLATTARVGLGHARLSIIDLDNRRSADRQRRRADCASSSTASSTTSRRSSASSRRAGHRLRTRSDSEIALHLYEDLGAQCLHHLRGEFAFVLWDERNRTLFAARDRFGIKPLFYAWHDGTLYLASEVEGAVRRRRAGALGRRDASTTRSTYGGPPDAHAVRRRLPGAARTLPARDRAARPAASVLGLRLPARRRASAQRSDADYAARVPRTRSRRRCASGCAPTCRSAAI